MEFAARSAPPVGKVPFWPECLHIKFPKIYLCKAIFYIFEIRSRKIKSCNVIFYLRQTNSPEFKYVISWVVRKGMCLRRRFSQEVSSRDACIAPRILDFSQEFGFSGAKFPWFSPVAPRILCFSQEFPSSENPWVFHRIFPLLMEHFLHFSTVLAPLHQESLVFCRISPLLMQKFLHFFHVLALLRHKSLGIHRISLF